MVIVEVVGCRIIIASGETAMVVVEIMAGGIIGTSAAIRGKTAVIIATAVITAVTAIATATLAAAAAMAVAAVTVTAMAAAVATVAAAILGEGRGRLRQALGIETQREGREGNQRGAEQHQSPRAACADRPARSRRRDLRKCDLGLLLLHLSHPLMAMDHRAPNRLRPRIARASN